MTKTWVAILSTGFGVALLVPLFAADDPPRRGAKKDQPPQAEQPKEGREPGKQPGKGGPGGFGGPGFGGPGGPPGGQEMKLVKQFDKDGDGRLNRAERDAAREFVKKERPAGGRGFGRGPGGPGGAGGPPQGGPPGGPPQGGPEGVPPGAGKGPPPGGPGGPGKGPPPGGPGKGPDGKGPPPGGPGGAGKGPPPGGPGGPGGFGPPGFGREVPEPKPGPKVKPADVSNVPASVPLYDSTVLRTLFLDFEDADWEAEMADFNNTDVDIPATLTVDGKTYPGVGVHFRGMSSFMGVRAGSKRSLNIALDFVDSKQRLYGYKTLNLLNAHEDASFLSSVLYSHIARRHIPAPKANLVKVVINGESWGVYPSVQQFNNEFLVENYQSKKGARWKVLGSPGGQGGLEYSGDNIEDYKRRYQMKSGDEKDWAALVELCRVLAKTPSDQLEAALEPILDLEGALWFLAIDNALINCDGYWIRASDYSLHRDEKGKFHVIPHDMNESFRQPMGPGMGMGGRGGRPGGGGPGPGGAPPAAAPAGGAFDLHPLIGLADARKPLRSKLLNVPSLKARYLEHVVTLAEELDWKNLGPVVAQYRALIEKEIEADTKKLSTFAEFQKATADTVAAGGAERGRRESSLRAFSDGRSNYLRNFEKGKTAPPPPPETAAGPGGPGGFGPGTFLAAPLLEAIDTNTDAKADKGEITAGVAKAFARWDGEKAGSIDEKVLTEGLAEMIPSPPGFFIRRGPEGEGPPRGPSTLWAGALFQKADANKDGKVTAEEFAALAEALAKEWDKDKNGSLDEGEISAGLTGALPAPSFGGPPR
jgi:Ca2+-binding EF-hand superfamily protein